MRKLMFFIVLFSVYYVGAMYENTALLVLFLTQFFLMLLMFFLSRYLEKHLTVSVKETTVYAERGRPFTVRLQIGSTVRFPVGGIVLYFRCGCENNGIRFSQEKRFGNLYETGKALSFRNTYSHCGNYTIQLKQLAVFDPMLLFSGKRKLKDEIRVVVFPEKYKMHLELSDNQADEAGMSGEAYGGLTEDQDDIRQIREYREGDLPRHIHWNQTARTGIVWVKEFESTKAGQIGLYLDFNGRRPFQVPNLDAFCILLKALLCGLLEKVASIEIYWDDPAGAGRSCMELREEQQCQDLFLFLYGCLHETYLKEYENGHEDSRSGVTDLDQPCALRLTPGLGLYKGNCLIYQFSGEKLQEELSQREFII